MTGIVRSAFRFLEHAGRGCQEPFDLLVTIGGLAAEFGIGGHESTAAMLAVDRLSEQADAHTQLPAADRAGLVKMHGGSFLAHGLTCSLWGRPAPAVADPRRHPGPPASSLRPPGPAGNGSHVRFR